MARILRTGLGTILLLAVGPALQAAVYDTVALTGTSGTYGPQVSGAQFSSIKTDFAINDSGNVIFRGVMATGGSVTAANDWGLWYRPAGGTPTNIVREGDTAVGGLDTLNDFAFPGYSGNHHSFVGYMPLGQLNKYGVFAGTPGSYDRIAVETEHAAGFGAGITYVSIYSGVHINSSGVVVFRAQIGGQGIDATNRMALYSATSSGDVAMFAHAGDAAPNTTGVFYDFSDAQINSAGTVAFKGVFQENINNVLTPGRGIYVGGRTNYQMVVRDGTQAAGTAAGVNYKFFDTLPFKLNENGQVAFRSQLQGTGITSSNDRGIWIADTSGVQKVVRTGDAVTTAPGTVFTGFTDPQFNKRGEVAFQGQMTGPGVTIGNGGVANFVATPTSLKMMARSGDVITQLGDPNIKYGWSSSTPLINDAGQVAFVADATGGSFFSADTLTNDLLMAGMPDDLKIIAQRGSLFDVDPTAGEDLRTIKNIFMGTGDSYGVGGAVKLTNDGLLVFGLDFTDGTSGLFTVQLDAPSAAVPEAGTLSLLGMCVAGLLARRRR